MKFFSKKETPIKSRWVIIDGEKVCIKHHAYIYPSGGVVYEPIYDKPLQRVQVLTPHNIYGLDEYLTLPERESV